MTTAAVVAGLGAVTPPRVVTNADLAGRLDTTDDWIYTRTGIRQRHAVDVGTATSDLAVEAGLRALKSAPPGDVGMVVLATTTPDHPCPATAPAVAARLGLGPVAAFDVAAVCSGFVYGLAVGAGAIAGGLTDRVLVVGAETYSTIVDPDDRSSAPIFGDGAGAVVLRAGGPGETGALGGFDLGSDGDLADLITVPGGGSRQRTSGQPPTARDAFFTMQGAAVFQHAVTRMAESAGRALDRTGWTVGDVDWFAGHQANARIVRAVADRLALPRDRALLNIDRVGNTSAASIPLALADAALAGRLAPGDRMLLAAFGGGLTWGAATFTWPDVDVLA